MPGSLKVTSTTQRPSSGTGGASQYGDQGELCHARLSSQGSIWTGSKEAVLLPRYTNQVKCSPSALLTVTRFGSLSHRWSACSSGLSSSSSPSSSSGSSSPGAPSAVSEESAPSPPSCSPRSARALASRCARVSGSPSSVTLAISVTGCPT